MCSPCPIRAICSRRDALARRRRLSNDRALRLHPRRQRPDAVPRPSGECWSGFVHTAVQAARGQQVFSQSCGNCHRVADQTGAAFRAKWASGGLGSLFNVISKTMPVNAAGSLARRTTRRSSPLCSERVAILQVLPSSCRSRCLGKGPAAVPLILGTSAGRPRSLIIGSKTGHPRRVHTAPTVTVPPLPDPS